MIRIVQLKKLMIDPEVHRKLKAYAAIMRTTMSDVGSAMLDAELTRATSPDFAHVRAASDHIKEPNE